MTTDEKKTRQTLKHERKTFLFISVSEKHQTTKKSSFNVLLFRVDSAAKKRLK